MSKNIDVREIKAEEKIPFNFTYYAMKLLGRNLYSNPWTAISEIVANGIDAKAPEICVLVDMRNKEQSIIEIFDNGYGMSYKDLCEKYTLIGRNKRNSIDNISGKTLGRKGIGKLAALYLSPKYYLFTKTKEESSSWVVNTVGINESEIPTLNRIANAEEILVAKQQWESCETGTLIHLTNVDLTNIGKERIKSLYAILTDYYLPSLIDSKIKVCVLSSENEKIAFQEIEKKISFKSMAAIFDNSGKEYAEELPEYTYVLYKSGVPELDAIREKTKSLDVSKYPIVGTLPITDLNGDIIDAEYALTGWIGIHSSLDKDVLERNDVNYKKIQNHPNALRLYVRGKLAVGNLMNYVGSTQALSNYIEGEISFDILDDDRFEDASTSNREGYSLSDPRVIKLIEIVKKIVTSLISERAFMGKHSNLLRDQYFNKLKEEEKKRREEEERKRQLAEAERIKAEQLAEEEKQKRIQSEEERDATKKQFYFLEQQLTEDDKTRAYNTHVIKNNANNIHDNLVLLLDEHPECKTYDGIKAISISDQKILTAVKYYNKVNYGLENKVITGDISSFIQQYVREVISSEYLTIHTVVDEPINWICAFSPQDLTVSLENVFSNANKAGANKVNVSFLKEKDCLIIQFSNNGKKLPENCNSEQLFEFGYSTSTSTGIAIGTGIGLFQIKELFVDDLGGAVRIFNNDDEGVTLEIKLYEA